MPRFRDPADSEATQSHPGAAISAYRYVAVTMLSVGLSLLVLNLLAALWMAFFGESPGAPKYLESDLQRAYPHRTPNEIRALLGETWNRRYRYRPFVQFSESAQQGRYVNVGEDGRRRTLPEGPWPPAPNSPSVYVFGGSTTFGYGVADEETLPSALAAAVAGLGCPNVAVYNFGQSNYYSTQERVLFGQLVSQGYVPKVAIFVDGLNEFLHPNDEPKFTTRLSRMMDESGLDLARRATKRLPLVRLLQTRFGSREAPERSSASADHSAIVGGVLQRWVANRRLIRAIAREHGVTPLFVWQPTPAWGYDLERHLFAESLTDLREGHLLQRGYETASTSHATHPEPDTLWLGDLDSPSPEPEYVDRVHYSASYTAEISAAIAPRIVPFLCPSTPVE